MAGIQTTNLIINLDHDDWILSDEGKTLAESGFGACSPNSARPHHASYLSSSIENETEVSFFNRDLYEAFKLDPQVFFPLHATLPRCDLTIATQRHDGKADLFSCFLEAHSLGIFGGISVSVCIVKCSSEEWHKIKGSI